MSRFATPAELRDFMEWTGSTGRKSDVNLGLLLDAASDYLEAKTGRTITSTGSNTTRTYSTQGRPFIIISDWRTITSVSLAGSPLVVDESYWAIPSRQASDVTVAIQLRSFGSSPEDVRSGADWPDVVLIDSPDFDSVERENRTAADRIFGEAEVLVFVTDVQKYADQSTWDYLERMDAARKPAVMVLNKAVGEGAAIDFRRRLDARPAGGATLVVIPELSIDDRTLLPANEPGLARLRLSVMATHTHEEIDTAVDMIVAAARELGAM